LRQLAKNRASPILLSAFQGETEGMLVQLL